MRLLRSGPKPRQALSCVEALCCLSDSMLLAAGSEGRVIALDLRPRWPLHSSHYAQYYQVIEIEAQHVMSDAEPDSRIAPSVSCGWPFQLFLSNSTAFVLKFIQGVRWACRSDNEELIGSKDRKVPMRSAPALPILAEHRLPHGVTSMCPGSTPGLPITLGTRMGDIFYLTMTKQVY